MNPNAPDTEDARLAEIEADYLSDEPRFPDDFDDPCRVDPWEALSWQ